MCVCVCSGRRAPGGWGDAGPAPPSAAGGLGPAALAALGSRPRRARRAGLGLRGGAGTGSGKQQCSGGGGGGGALPLQEPSAGRRAGAAASRDCGPRRPHGRRGGESRRRPAAAERQARGADLPREDAPTRTWDPASPCVLLPQPHPGLRPRFTALPLPLAGSPLPSHGPQREPCFPGPQSSPIRAWCAPPAPLPAHPTFSVRAFPSHASDAPFSPDCTLGCASRPAGSGRAFVQAPGRRNPPCEAGAGAPCAPREPGALRGSHLAAELDPGTSRARGPARPRARNQHRAGLCFHLASRMEPAQEAGGRRGRESGCASESATGR